MRRSKKAVGIEIASSSVRVVEVAGPARDGSAVVSRSAVVPLSTGAVTRGVIRRHVEVGAALTQAVKEAGVRPYGAIVGFGGTSAMAERLIPAAIPAADYDRFIREEGTPISASLDLSEAVLGIDELDVVETSEGLKRRLTVAAIDYNQLELVIKVCYAAKIEPRAIDLVPTAAMRGYLRVPEDDTTVSTLVDVGATRTLVITRKGADVRSVQQISIGGDHFTDAIMGALNVDRAAAEARKQAYYVGDQYQASSDALRTGYGSAELADTTAPKDRLAQKVEEVTANLTNELADAIQTEGDNHNSEFTTEIVLGGGGGMLKGLVDRVQLAVQVPSQSRKPQITLQKTASNLAMLGQDQENPDGMLASLATATGLALWKPRS
jgi:Tfp pilus assembly PilM family ATPase